MEERERRGGAASPSDGYVWSNGRDAEWRGTTTATKDGRKKRKRMLAGLKLWANSEIAAASSLGRLGFYIFI